MLPLVRILRVASIAICLIVGVSFAIFAIDQTNSASHRQTEATLGIAPSPAPAVHHPPKNPLHRAIDDAANRLTSPFSGVVSSNSGEWATRGVKLLLTLLVYGFGLGYLARVLRVRV